MPPAAENSAGAARARSSDAPPPQRGPGDGGKIFTLGRPDTLPADDFGIREGFRVAYGSRARPTPRKLLAFGERWRPYRSTAAWYLWRAAERARNGKREARAQ